MDNKVSTGGVSFGGLLTVLFIGLKLTGTINWSWIWVLSPLWIPLVLFVAATFIIFIVGVILIMIENMGDDE